MDNAQIERLFSMLSDIDRRLTGRLDHITDNLSSFRSELAALNAWKTTVEKAELEQRLRILESKHIELEPIKNDQRTISKRVLSLEKTVTKAAAIWATVAFIGGVAIQVIIHYIWRGA